MKQHWKQQFVIIYAGQAFSLLGSAAVQFSIIWWLTIRTESAITLTLASIVAFLPNICFGPFAGIWIDRYNRRNVMMAADGLVALSSAVLGAVFLITEAPPIPFIYGILFIRGLGNTFHSPAMQAAIPMLVPREMLTKAGGWGNLINSIANMLGPVLGAALMGLFPIAGIMLVDIGGAAFAILCLFFVRIPDVSQEKAAVHIWTDMKQGFHVMKNNKPLIAVFLPMVLVNLLYMPLGSLFPLLIRTHFMGQAWHNSLAEFVFAAGLLVSSIIIGIWGGMRKRFLMTTIAIGILGAVSLLSGALPAEGFPVFVICCFIMGNTGTFINVPLMAYTQESTPPEMMGKVFALLMTAMTLAMPAGLLVAGPVSEIIGVERWFFWSGAGIIGTAVLCRILTKPYDAITLRPDSRRD